jgi:hypothetical protein
MHRALLFVLALGLGACALHVRQICNPYRHTTHTTAPNSTATSNYQTYLLRTLKPHLCYSFALADQLTEELIEKFKEAPSLNH